MKRYPPTVGYEGASAVPVSLKSSMIPVGSQRRVGPHLS